MVEADGEWHTIDNKYASARWQASHPPAVAEKLSPHLPSPSIENQPPSPPKNDDSVRAKGEIVILDSDDEDEGRVKRELSPSFASRSSRNLSYSDVGPVQHPLGEDVIDLTLDSDDEGPSAPLPLPSPVSSPVAPRIAEKRKASDSDVGPPPQAMLKKSRADVNNNLMRAMAMRTLNMPMSGNATPANGSRDQHGQRPSLPRYPNTNAAPPLLRIPRYEPAYHPQFSPPHPDLRRGGHDNN